MTTIIDLHDLIEQHSGVSLVRVSSSGQGEYAGPCPFCGGQDRFRVWPYSVRPLKYNQKIYKMACQASLWYNKHRKNIVPGQCYQHSQAWTKLLRSFIMDSVPQNSSINNSKRCCTACNKEFPLTSQYFHRDKKSKDGLMTQCKTCRRAKKKQWADAHRDHINAYMADYYQRPEKRERALRYAKVHYQRPDVIERVHAYSNLPHRREIRRKQYALKSRNRRAKERESKGAHTVQDIQKQYDRQKGECYYCGQKVGSTYHVDHIIPISRGGSNGTENLVISCPRCNMSKNDKLPHEWAIGGRLL